MKIKTLYTTCDGVRRVRNFKHVESAREYVITWVGRGAEAGSTYLVSGDGIATMEIIVDEKQLMGEQLERFIRPAARA